MKFHSQYTKTLVLFQVRKYRTNRIKFGLNVIQSYVFSYVCKNVTKCNMYSLVTF